jgi:hypothetical protein
MKERAGAARGRGMDDVERRFGRLHGNYAEEDPKALAELERRIPGEATMGRTIE